MLMRRTWLRRPTAVVVCCAMVVAACGDDGDAETDAASPTSEADDEPATTEATGQAPDTTAGEDATATTVGEEEGTATTEPGQDRAEGDNTVLGLPDLSGQEIVVNTYGGSYLEALQEHVLDPFAEATGAEIVVEDSCCETFATTVESGQFAGDFTVGGDVGPMLAWADSGYLIEDPRLSEIATARGVPEQYVSDSVMAVSFYAWLLAAAPDAPRPGPQSWEEFWDVERFPGTRGLFGRPAASIEVALLADGVSPDELFPLDVERGISKIAELRDATTVTFWGSGAELIQLLANGEIDYAVGLSNRVMQAQAEGIDIGFTFNEALLAVTGAAIPAGARNVEGAVALMDFYMQPEIQAAFAGPAALAPAYSSANELLDDETRSLMVTAPENIGSTVARDDVWWNENFDATLERYQQFVATGE